MSKDLTEDEVQMAAKAVLYWVTREHAEAVGRCVSANAEERGQIAAKRAWAEANPADYGVENPFEDRHGAKKEASSNASRRMTEWGIVQRFVVERLCNMVK